jgi:hypothetical protein
MSNSQETNTKTYGKSAALGVGGAVLIHYA